MSLKSFTVVVATFNSEATVELTLKAIRAQDYPQELIEILMIDGGSTDRTREIGRAYGARIVENPRVEPISARLIGLKEAEGDLILTCDSDEVMTCNQSIRRRALALTENENCPIGFGCGYKSPEGANFLTCFINEFGDPFSMFYYRLSKDARFLINTLRERTTLIRETDDYVVFELQANAKQLIMENGAGSNVMDLKFFRKEFPELIGRPQEAVHMFFYHMQALTKRFAVIKDEGTLHYSTPDFKIYRRKLHWRIVNYLFYPDMASAGFKGREAYDSTWSRFRKYLFLPYVFLIIPAVLDALRLCVTRRDPRYILVWPLTTYTALLIVGYGILKVLGLKPKLKAYGETSGVSGTMPDEVKPRVQKLL